MARPKSVTSTATVNVAEDEKKEAIETSIVEESKPVEKTEKPAAKKVFNFADDEDVKIISKNRAGKKIVAVTGNAINFDDKGAATVKGKDAVYLLNSGLGFDLSK